MAISATSRALAAIAWLLLAACSPPRPSLVEIPAQMPASLAIRDVSLLDVETGETAPGRDVLVQGDRIAAIAASGSLPLPGDARILDGRGATLLPGLVDAHGHIGVAYAPLWRSELPDPAHNLEAFLYCGVTTLLDPSDSDAGAVARRDALRRGELVGPRVYTAGRPLTAPGGHPVALIEALRAATLDPARFLEQSDDSDFGLLRPGKRADLLLVEGDPTRDIANVSRIRAVVLGGRPLERHPLGGRGA